MPKTHTLKYLTGEKIRVGDTVKYEDSMGKIVFVISSKDYSHNYSEEDWSYLKVGFGIETERYGLIHQIEPDEDLCFIKHEI